MTAFIRTLAILAGIWLLAAPLHAEEEKPADAAPSFWKAEGENNTVWLFGSVHVLTENHYPLADKVEEAFEESAYLVVETDVVNVDPQVQQQMMISAGMLPDGTTLKDVLGEDRYARARALAEENGYNLDQMAMLRPWLIALVLSITELERMGYTADHGVETYFLNRVDENRKSIVELETLQFQISLFDDMDEETETAFLMQTLEEIQDLESQMKELMDAWEAGELERLEETMLADFKDYPDVYERIVTQRNHQWIDDLSRFLDEGKQDYFVVVGALHMVGDEGVINLLREAGYTVTRQ